MAHSERPYRRSVVSMNALCPPFCPGEGIERQGRFDQVGERVEAFSHVGRLGADEDPHGWRPTQHERPSKTARTSPRVRGSNPSGTRTIGPSGRRISIGMIGRADASRSSMTCTGKRWVTSAARWTHRRPDWDRWRWPLDRGGSTHVAIGKGWSHSALPSDRRRARTGHSPAAV